MLRLSFNYTNVREFRVVVPELCPTLYIENVPQTIVKSKYNTQKQNVIYRHLLQQEKVQFFPTIPQLTKRYLENFDYKGIVYCLLIRGKGRGPHLQHKTII